MVFSSTFSPASSNVLIFHDCAEKIFSPILLLSVCFHISVQRQHPRLNIRPCRCMGKTLTGVWNIQIPKHFHSETLQMKTVREVLIPQAIL